MRSTGHSAEDAEPISASDPTAHMPVVEDDSPSKHVRLFGSHQFFRLWIAQLISATGDWIGFFAIAALAAQIANRSPGAAISVVMAARVAPGFFLAPIIGVLVDRWDRKKVMIISDLSRAAVFFLLPFVNSVFMLVIASLILEVFTLLWSPAKEASVPNIVPADHLTTANSLSLVAAYGTIPIAGAVAFGLDVANDALAGVSWLGPLQFAKDFGETQALAFYFDGLTFLTTAVIVSTLTLPRVDRDLQEEGHLDKLGFTQAWYELKEGWQFIFVNPVVRAVIIGMATGLIGGAMLIPLGPIFATELVNNADAYPLFITAMGLGVAAGVISLSAWQHKVPKARVFLMSVLGAGLSLFLAVSMSSFWLAALFVLVLGLCAGSVYVLGFTLLHESTDDELRGRIFSTLFTLVRLCVLLALFVGPLLSTLTHTVSRAVFSDHPYRVSELDGDPIPYFSVLGVEILVPGVRIALWLAAVIIVAAGYVASKSMQIGIREGVLRRPKGKPTTESALASGEKTGPSGASDSEADR